jgi:hypothetical protein
MAARAQPVGERKARARAPAAHLFRRFETVFDQFG